MEQQIHKYAKSPFQMPDDHSNSVVSGMSNKVSLQGLCWILGL